MSDAESKLELAGRHLDRVLTAWDIPTDWDDLTMYGFYCLEAAVQAAALVTGIDVKPTHPSKVTAAELLHAQHDLPDVAGLLRDLNEARKAAAYGDVPSPDLDAEDVARDIEEYVDAVSTLVMESEEE